MLSMRLRHSRSAFTLIELLIGMTIFAIGITAIFLLLQQTMRSASISRNEVVASNLLREQIELVRNIRDTNIANYAPWNVAKTEAGVFASGVYIVENNFTETGVTFGADGKIMTSPVTLSGISLEHTDNLSDSAIISEKFNQTRLYLDSNQRYTHKTTATGTAFASYIIITPLQFQKDGQEIVLTTTGADGVTPVPQGYMLDARVIVRDGSYYREYDAKSAITDWIR